MITQITDFKGEISIPNPAKVSESLQTFINKYEPICLKNILGYALYKAYALSPGEQRFLDLIYGKEYTDSQGALCVWQGFIYANSPMYPILNVIGYSQRPSEQIQTGVTTGVVAGQNGFTFDGLNGKPDWRGETIVISRAEFGTMFEGLDYSFNSTTGEFLLLKDGDVLSNTSYFSVIFNPKPILDVSQGGAVTYFNNLANYIYWYIMQDRTVWNSGTGTAIPKKNDAVDISPVLKMTKAWNEFSSFVEDMRSFLETNSDTYPEFDYGCSLWAHNFSYRVNEFDI